MAFPFNPFRHEILLFLLLNFIVLSVSAQDKVYPNMPFRVYRLNNGFVMGAELQGAKGPTVENDSISGKFAGVSVLAGYQATRNFVVSAGTGILYYRKGSLVPLFLDFRYAITSDRLSPYIYADGGLLLKRHSLNSTTTFINPGFGLQYSVSNDFALVFSAGYWLQRGEKELNAFIDFKGGVKYKF